MHRSLAVVEHAIRLLKTAGLGDMLETEEPAIE
jgi:hypothetical protein